MPMPAVKDRLAGATLFVALVVASPVGATTFHVGAGCDYTTIAAAISAAAGVVGSNQILVAANQTYANEALAIDGQSLTIAGVPACNYLQPSGNTTIGGGNGHSVLTIRGDSHVRLKNLTISDGHPSDNAAGGGIDFAGTGTLSLDHTTVSNNHAGYGGGINVNGSGGAAYLNLGTETQVLDNTATTSGGGVRIEGQAVLTITVPQVWLAFNDAVGGYGGGLEVIGPARADLGSPGYRFAEYAGLLYQNSAQYGGGIAILGGSNNDQDAFVHLFTTDAHNPVLIEGNTATHTGGGIYLQPDSNGLALGFAWLCGIDYRLTGNIAQEGSALYSDEDSDSLGNYFGALISLGPPSGWHPACRQTALPAGVAACTSETCNSVDHNVAQNGAGQPTAGSAILLQTSTAAGIDRIRITDNTGAHALRLAGGGGGDNETTYGNLSNCVFARNIDRSDLVAAETVTSLSLKNCTLAYNQIDSTIVVRAAGALDFEQSIIAQGVNATSALHTGSPSSLVLDYLLSMEVVSLSAGSHVQQGDPSFIDVAHGDYRLMPNSLAIDVAPPIVGDDRDLDGLPHDQDMSYVANQDGDRDLGAYERQKRYCGAADTVYCDDFEFD